MESATSACNYPIMQGITMQIIYMCNQRVTTRLTEQCCPKLLWCRGMWRRASPAGRLGPGLDGGSKPSAATAGQSYLRLSASLRSQHSPGWPATRAIKGNIRRYYKLLTRQTTRWPGCRSAPPVSSALHEARSGRQDIQLNAYIRDASQVKSPVLQSSFSLFSYSIISAQR